MCDQEKLNRWAREGLNRREFGVLGAAAVAVAACAPKSGLAGESVRSVTEQTVSFSTPDGTMDAWLAAPAGGPGPAVILWPDIAGVRDSKKAMARRLADRGYSALVVNPYYRDVTGEQFADFAAFIADGGFKKVGPWRGKLDAAAIMRDAEAAVAFLDGLPEVDTSRGIGTQGYCMGGPFAMWTAAAVPTRIKAAASFHGGGLVRPDNPMSPHRLFDRMDAALLIAIAQDDDAESPDEKDVLREASRKAGRMAVIEVFAGDHGWCVPDSPAYLEDQAERAWAELMQIYAAL